jgi:hypothetical protein
MLCAAGIPGTISAVGAGRRRAWAAACGFLCLLAQGITVELGVYAVLIVVPTFLLLYCRADRRAVTEGLIISLGLFMLANLIIGFVLRPAFSYHRHALEMLRGYTYGMGSNWELARWPTIALTLVGAYCLLAGASLLRRLAASDFALVLGLLLCSAASLKSALIRSDLGHITQGLSPSIALFLILGFTWPVSRAARVLWAGLYVALLFAWPWTGTNALRHFSSAFDGTAPLNSKWKHVVSVSSKAGDLLPPELRGAFGTDLGKPILAFPYENSVGVALGRPLVAPVLLAINAATTALQDYYVDELERHAQEIEVVYGVDGIGSSPIDSVQAITRTPIIFEYLWRYYELRRGWKPGDGFYLLGRRPSPKGLHVREIGFHLNQLQRGVTEAILEKPAACNIVRFELDLRYPAASFLGRPVGLDVIFLRNGNTVHRSPLVPIEVSRAFSADISLAAPDRFIEIFGPEPPPGIAWDKVQFAPRPADWLGWLPRRLEIVSIECLD